MKRSEKGRRGREGTVEEKGRNRTGAGAEGGEKGGEAGETHTQQMPGSSQWKKAREPRSVAARRRISCAAGTRATPSSSTSAEEGEGRTRDQRHEFLVLRAHSERAKVR